MKIRLVLPLSSRSATWLLLPGLVLVAVYASSQPIGDVRGYWTGVVSSATTYSVFSCGFGAVAAAIDSSRLRKARIFRQTSSRGPIRILLNSLWPAVLLSVVLQAAGFFFEAEGSWGSPGSFPVMVLVAWAGMIAFHVSLGALLGLALPAFAAAPLALIASYVWLGFTWSVDYVPLRYLSGLAISGCCAVYSDLAPAAPVSVIVFSLSGVLAALLIVTNAWRTIRFRAIRVATIATAVMAIGAISALSIATGLGSYPSPPRSSADLVCQTGSGTKICLYPEQLWQVSPSPVPVLQTAIRNLKAAGVAAPRLVTGDLTANGAGTITLLYRSNFTPQTTIHSFSSEFGQMSPSLVCKRDEVNPDTQYVASGVIGGLVYYYATKGDVDPLINDSEIEKPMHSLLAQSRDAQLLWLTQARAANANCSLPFPALPPAS